MSHLPARLSWRLGRLFSFRNVAVPHQIASANRTATQPTPQKNVDVLNTPANASRTAVTTNLMGMMFDAVCSHCGPRVIGSRMPDNRSTGIITMLITGASTSSLFVVRARAFDPAAQADPSTTVSATPMTIPYHGPRMPNASPSATRISASTDNCVTSRSTRPMSRAVRLAGVTRSASMTPSRHSPIRLKPANIAPKTPSWTSIRICLR